MTDRTAGAALVAAGAAAVFAAVSLAAAVRACRCPVEGAAGTERSRRAKRHLRPGPGPGGGPPRPPRPPCPNPPFCN
ncbi:hypothetical protein BX285_4592 [Streptomyces sp. 1114.5]|uniref:hypothetical protein n=1 Tax=Streptomyces sp. 1114.5 TaxID=1938830 RepID=UPI000F12E2D7|nr:hypothetical protein [Streptomyces sp. 1114.5]RKT20111.1 hypothetical protein BX285_4592 [Streptomyces sp. 1114.5]